MRNHIHREPLTSDVIFKTVFGQDTPESKAALIELLNLVDIEMQTEQRNIYANRPHFYRCKQLTKGLAGGEEYDEMKKNIVIFQIAKLDKFPRFDTIGCVYR